MNAEDVDIDIEVDDDRARDEEVAARFRELRDTRDPRLRNQLVEDHRWIAMHCARKFADRGEPHDDLFQVAQLGLLKAVGRFDPDFGTAFPAYAIPTVMGELRRHFRDATWGVHVPRAAKDLAVSIPKEMEALRHQLGRPPRVDELAARMGVSEEAVLEGLDASKSYRPASLSAPAFEDGSPHEWGSDDVEMDRVEMRMAVERLLQTLPEKERKIVTLRFYGGLSQSEIAAQIGISQMHVSRLLRGALESLRTAMPDAPGTS